MNGPAPRAFVVGVALAVGAVGLVSAAGCGADVRDGVTAQVDLAFENFDGLLGTNEGYFVTVNGAWITTSGIELLPCASASASLGQRWLRWLAPVQTAHAHLASSSTMIGTTQIERVGTNTDEYGQLEPPPGSWCEARYILLDADDDAIGLDATPDMLGHSLVVRGTWVRGDDDGTFEVATSFAFDRAIPFAEPLTLTGDDTARITIVRDVRRWFDDVDFERMPDDVLTETVLFNVFDSVTYVVDVEGVADGLAEDPGAPPDPFGRE